MGKKGRGIYRFKFLFTSLIATVFFLLHAQFTYPYACGHDYCDGSSWRCEDSGHCYCDDAIDCGPPSCGCQSDECAWTYGPCDPANCYTYLEECGGDEACSSRDGDYCTSGTEIETRDYWCDRKCSLITSGVCSCNCLDHGVYSYSNRHSCGTISCPPTCDATNTWVQEATQDPCNNLCQGSGPNAYCGTCTCDYQNAQNCNNLDGCYGNTYKDYSCDSGSCSSSDTPCDNNYCDGTCGTGIDSCRWRDGICYNGCTFDQYDPDLNSGYCTNCGETWAATGESSAHGEYNPPSITTGCCGDDSGEHYIDYTIRGCPGASANRCCDNANDYISADNECVDSCCSANGMPCDHGNECCSDYCVEGVGFADCRANCDGYNGHMCSYNSDTSYLSFGVCTQGPSGAQCDTTEAARSSGGGTIYYDCQHSSVNYGWQCDQGSLGGGFGPAGLCGGASHADCHTNYASDTTSSITSGSHFGAQEEVCDAENTWYCDYIGDASFAPSTKRCDASDDKCATCDLTNKKESGGDNGCESGCGASSNCDEVTYAYHWWCNTNHIVNGECGRESGSGFCTYYSSSGDIGTCEYTDDMNSNCGGSNQCDELVPNGWWCNVNHVITSFCDSECGYQTGGGDTGECEYTDSYNTNCGGDLTCDEQVPGYDFVVGQICNWCSSSCAASSDTTVGSTTCTSCASGYQMADSENRCYYSITCNNGWTDATYDTCLDEGNVSGGKCYYDEGCSGSGANNGCENGESSPYSCDFGAFSNGACYCYRDAANQCLYQSSDCCAADDDGWDYYNVSCYDPGTEIGNSCYYDNGAAVNEADSCTTTGCTGISSQTHPTCNEGDMGGSGADCEQINYTGSNDRCLYSNTDACQADTDGWDYSQDTTIGTFACVNCGAVGYGFEYSTNDPDICYSQVQCTNTGWTAGVTVTCDNYDDVDGSDGKMTESESSAAYCSSSCSGSGCCDNQQRECKFDYQCDYFYDLITNEDETPNHVCYRSKSAAWIWDSVPEEDELSVCSDHYDNDCDGECDYDSMYCGHGDSDCPVQITGISVNNNTPCTGQVIYLNCTSNPGNINSVLGYWDLNHNGGYDSGEQCNFNGWTWNIAKFNCSSPVVDSETNYTLGCAVDGQKSYQNGQNYTENITVGKDLPKVTSISPEDNAKITSFWDANPIVFDFSVFDWKHNLFNCSLFVGRELEQNKLDIGQGAHNFTLSLSNGNYTWYIRCIDQGLCDNTGFSERRNLEIAIPEGLQITNFGQIGFPNISQVCTTSIAVILFYSYSPTAVSCRFSNEDTMHWTAWHTCSSPEYWSLVNEEGIRRVYLQINHSDSLITTHSDSIQYDQSGYCLLFASPTMPVVIDDGDYTNNNTKLAARWYGAKDPQAEAMGLKLAYEYRILDENKDVVVNWTDTGQYTEAEVTGLELENGKNYTFFIRVTNSNNLTNVSSSDGIVVDTIAPTASGVHSTTHECNSWTHSTKIGLTWNGEDTISGIKGYSYILNKNPSSNPDTYIIKSGNEVIYNGVSYGDGQYYFNIRPVDNANNWGNTVRQNDCWYGIDTSPPTKPEVLHNVQYADSNAIMCAWLPAADGESGIDDYLVNITDIESSQGLVWKWLDSIDTWYQADNATPGHNYLCEIISLNKAGLNSSSDFGGDVEPPEILFKKPNGLIANSPILVLETNENAVCYYNLSYNYIEFEHTSDLYHESLIDAKPSETPYVIGIKCIDNAGLATIDELSFTYDDSVTLANLGILTEYTPYIGVNFKITVNTVPGVGEIRKDSFALLLNGKPLGGSDYIMTDKGDGIYFIHLVPRIIGPHNIVLSVDLNGQEVNDSISFDVSELVQSVNYDDSDMYTAQDQQFMIYNDELGSLFGLAGDGDNTETVYVEKNLGLYTRLNGNMYLFGTRQSPLVKDKQKYLSSKTFNEYTNKFGYPIDKNQYLRILIREYQVGFTNTIVLDKGEHQLFIKNLGLGESGKVMLEIKRK
ncbi:fibronectin type III domain-containing protein [Candidatus Woesearchaeota archaeon]|nr:fibronectin type III domain-containing protein [Candidatus Woesearchaeota archaeon]